MKTNFTIQVTNELDAEYAQRFLYRHGIKWFFNVPGLHDETANMGFIYVRRGKIDGWDRKGNISWSDPTYKFPSQYEEIVKLLEKEKEPEFKVGDWIYIIKQHDTKYPVGSICKISAIKLSGLHFHTCIESGGIVIKDNCRKAASSEIESHLIKEAEKKGFVVGAKICNDAIYAEGFGGKGRMVGGYRFGMITEDSLEAKVENGLYLTIYKNNKWATLKPSHPQIIVNGFTAKFEDWGLDFNDGCAKVDKELFLSIIKNLDVKGEGNKSITSVKIGAGEFTASQIKEIADYYNSK